MPVWVSHKFFADGAIAQRLHNAASTAGCRSLTTDEGAMNRMSIAAPPSSSHEKAVAATHPISFKDKVVAPAGPAILCQGVCRSHVSAFASSKRFACTDAPPYLPQMPVCSRIESGAVSDPKVGSRLGLSEFKSWTVIDADLARSGRARTMVWRSPSSTDGAIPITLPPYAVPEQMPVQQHYASLLQPSSVAKTPCSLGDRRHSASLSTVQVATPRHTADPKYCERPGALDPNSPQVLRDPI